MLRWVTSQVLGHAGQESTRVACEPTIELVIQSPCLPSLAIIKYHRRFGKATECRQKPELYDSDA